MPLFRLKADLGNLNHVSALQDWAMAPKVKKKPAKQAKKKPAARVNNSGLPGGGSDARAEARYRSRIEKGKIRECSTQWDVDDQAEAERQLQKWLLMQKAKALEQEMWSWAALRIADDVGHKKNAFGPTRRKFSRDAFSWH